MSTRAYLSLATALVAVAAVPAREPAQVTSGTALVRLIEQAEIPAQTAGVLREFTVLEGAGVAAGDVIAELDDADAVLALERARLELEAADRLAQSDSRLRQVRTAVVESEADLNRANLELELARLKSDSEIPLRAAKLAAPVAEADLQRAQSARRNVRDSVSERELDQLKLAHERAKLDVEQAEHDRQAAALLVKVKSQEIASLAAGVERRRAELEEAAESRDVAAITRRLKSNGVAAAERELERRRLRAPIPGVVVSTHRRPGEWVDPGDRVARVIRLDRLRIETFLKVEVVRRLGVGNAALFTPSDAGAQDPPFRGKIVFISPEVDPVNGQVLVWAEVENPGPEFSLRPGTRGTLAITPDGQVKPGGAAR